MNHINNHNLQIQIREMQNNKYTTNKQQEVDYNHVGLICSITQKKIISN